jgi:hypothetical protein
MCVTVSACVDPVTAAENSANVLLGRAAGKCESVNPGAPLGGGKCSRDCRALVFTSKLTFTDADCCSGRGRACTHAQRRKRGQWGVVTAVRACLFAAAKTTSGFSIMRSGTGCACSGKHSGRWRRGGHASRNAFPFPNEILTWKIWVYTTHRQSDRACRVYYKF